MRKANKRHFYICQSDVLPRKAKDRLEGVEESCRLKRVVFLNVVRGEMPHKAIIQAFPGA